MNVDYTKLALPKTPHVPQRRARRAARTRREARRAARNAVVAATRRVVFALDARCVACLGPAAPDDQMHEIISRAKTRGLPPEARFNAGNCVRLHAACHQAVTLHRIELALVDPAIGVPGGLIVQRRGYKDAWLYLRWPAGHHEYAGRGTAARGIWTPEDGGSDG